YCHARNQQRTQSTQPRGQFMTSSAVPTGHIDTFARDHLPPAADWPAFSFGLPGGGALEYPEQLNCAVELLDVMVAAGHGGRPCVVFDGKTTTYRKLLEQANQIANVLVDDLGLQPGNRVLLRGPNNPAIVACWYAVIKA